MEELIVNLHMHTTYSDGTGSHKDIAQAALKSGVDVVIVTDHNVLVHGLDSYLQKAQKRVLVLIGEEVHDRMRQPQKNHLLVIGANREMASFAPDPQLLINAVNQANGLSFIAHPYDPPLEMFGETDISWINWDVNGFTGLELWNGFSEFKARTHSYLQGVFYAFFPDFLAHGPLPATLAKWDELLANGRRVVAVGGSDAHALHKSAGFIRRTVFPYEFHFRGVNNHLLVENPLSGDLNIDRRIIYSALRRGNSFIGYDLPASTRGFRFTAQSKDQFAHIGDEIALHGGVTFQIRLPQKAECRLLCNGEVIKTWHDREICAHISTQPGVYRVECYLNHLYQKRGWIFSNPIYVRNT